MAYKVKVKNKNFIGLSHGLKFEGGVSEEFDNSELYHRLLKKGYEKVDVEAEKKALEDEMNEAKKKAEAAIQKRIDEAVAKALAEDKTKKSENKKA